MGDVVNFPTPPKVKTAIEHLRSPRCISSNPKEAATHSGMFAASYDCIKAVIDYVGELEAKNITTSTEAEARGYKSAIEEALKECTVSEPECCGNIVNDGALEECCGSPEPRPREATEIYNAINALLAQGKSE